MKTIAINPTTNIQVVEHMKEIKEVCNNSELFKRWYNRSQLFKALLGKFTFNGRPEDEENCGGEHGTCSGRIVHSHASCWFIEIYKLEDVAHASLERLIEWQVNTLHTAFFIEDRDGQVYLVLTDVD
jgi:hypothetical protein